MSPTTTARPASPSFAELPSALRTLPAADEAIAAAARQRQDSLTKPRGSLGRLEDLAAWLASWQGRVKPELDRPRCLVFAGNHGIAARGVSAYPSAVTAQMVLNFEAGGAAINQLCERFGIALQVIPLELDRPTVDFTQGPALDVEAFERAFKAGFESVAADTSVLLVGEMGIGNSTAAAAICTALFGGPAAAWVGPGTGVDHDGLTNKRSVIEMAVSRHRALLGRPLEALRVLGGRELAAIAGAVTAARLQRVPVLLDGFISTAAVAALQATQPGALAHCMASHASAEPGHRKLLDELGLEPVLGLRMRLGEASGAAVAYAILAAAVACHNGMATFAEAGVSEKAG
jgi:nicotinate-nucleotide--dimethylbenzimidazole phosphoribosyltransferase